MITERSTRLVRVPGLRALHAFIAGVTESDPAVVRASAVIVPTRGAAAELRRTIEDRVLHAGDDGRRALVLPDLLTRGELYAALHQRLPDAPPPLTEFEREVLFRRAARAARDRGAPPPFRLRAGLIVEILAFYDELRRRDRSVADFDRLMSGSLEPSADADRGAERMLRQTRFLSAAFAEFEARVAASGGIDEHGLRELLISGSAACAYRRLIITVPDQSADARGLWLADYDLLARIPGLERLDILATENVVATGFHERIHDALPGIEEERYGEPTPLPVLAVPERLADSRTSSAAFTCRDREDELVDVARRVKLRAVVPVLDRSAVVFQRPLPYLYLARHVFGDAGIPYQTRDALPLAAEPFAAAVDLVFAFLTSEATRASLVELLSSPHWTFTGADGRVVTREQVAAADRWLRRAKYVGGWDQLASVDFRLKAEATADTKHAARHAAVAPAIGAAHTAAIALQPVVTGPAASAQIAALTTFIRTHERLPHRADPWYDRQLRARGAILGALQALAQAHATHDDEPIAIGDLVGTIRRWIEGQTFSPRTGSWGVKMMDATAAGFADVDDLRIAGLVESDWPERSGRSIFYPASLLSQLGWPAETDRLAAARARFQDLLALPARSVSVSTFTLEDDAIVAPSPFVEELDLAPHSRESVPPLPAARVFVHEAISAQPVVEDAVSGAAAAWVRLRLSRSPAADARFHGGAGLREPGVYAVSHVERYLECPFKYFAAHVLRLDEERDDESGLTPQERGQFLHAVFEQFFQEWQESGRRAISTANITDALAMFEGVAEARLATLGESDRELERNYLLGSAAASGLAARAFAFEVEQSVEVIERLIEYTLEGEFEFAGADGRRRVRLRAKADRIDLLEDGTLRLVDYKLSKAPKASRALQLPVYAVCAQQHLGGRHGRTWTLSRAGYVAFREKNPFVALGASSSLEEALAAGQQRFLEAIDAIESGVFPPRPDEPFICTRCGYPTVCRKDYVGDE